MSNRKRSLALGDGGDIPAASRGMAKFFTECELEGDGVIVVPEMKTLKFGMLKDVLGEDAIKLLARDRLIKWRNRSISVCSDRTLRNFRNAKVYAAMWVRPGIIDDIEGFRDWRSLIWVTWSPEEATAWEKAHKPEII